MRKVMALAVAAVLMTGIAATPASAVTGKSVAHKAVVSKVGTKCTARLAIIKVNGVKYYCGKNKKSATKKRMPLVWVKSGVCYDGIVEYRNTAVKYASAKAQFATMQAAYAAIDTKTLDAAGNTSMQSVGASLGNLKTMLDMLGPVAKQLGSNIASLCA